MKVLMFGWEYPPHITGGLGTACFGLTKGLLKHGVEVIFVVPKAYGDEDQRFVRIVNASDITVDIDDPLFREYWKRIRYMEIGSNIIPYVGPEEFRKIMSRRQFEKSVRNSHVLSKQFTFSGKYGSELMEEVSRYALIASALAATSQFDVIHAHDWLTYPAGIAAKGISGKQLIMHMHATEFDRSGENINKDIYDIERKGMEEADRVITVSNFTRNIVIERYGIHPDKVLTVHNAVEPVNIDEFKNINKNVDEKIVSFLGRVTFQKGPDYFVEAAHRVIQNDEKVRFVMAGEGDMLNRMIRRVAQLRIGDKFHFTGFLNRDYVNTLYAMSDVYVMPSVSEPFGISPLEAMRSNVPVVISKQSGVSEILVHALKVDFWDIDALADAIYGLLHYEALSKMFIKYGKSEVDNLKWDNAAYEVLQVYDSLVNPN